MIIFMIFKILSIILSIIVVTSKNPIHSILALIGVFLNICGLLIMVEVEFLAFIFLIVYIGAIAVLFLFVVMMLNIRISEMIEQSFSYFLFTLSIGIVIISQLSIFLLKGIGGNITLEKSYLVINEMSLNSNIQNIGLIIYTDNFLLFVLSGIILLLAMVGSISLTLYHKEKTKKQNIVKQLSRLETILIK